MTYGSESECATVTYVINAQTLIIPRSISYVFIVSLILALPLMSLSNFICDGL